MSVVQWKGKGPRNVAIRRAAEQDSREIPNYVEGGE